VQNPGNYKVVFCFFNWHHKLFLQIPIHIFRLLLFSKFQMGLYPMSPLQAVSLALLLALVVQANLVPAPPVVDLGYALHKATVSSVCQLSMPNIAI
jgi:hypothetical protein